MPYNPRNYVPPQRQGGAAIAQIGQDLGNLASSLPGTYQKGVEFDQQQEDRKRQQELIEKAAQAAKEDKTLLGKGYKGAKNIIKENSQPLVDAKIMTKEEQAGLLSQLSMPTNADIKNPSGYLTKMNAVAKGILENINKRMRQLDVGTKAQGLLSGQGGAPGQPPQGQAPGQTALAGQQPQDTGPGDKYQGEPWPEAGEAPLPTQGLAEQQGQPTPAPNQAPPQASPQALAGQPQPLAGQKQPGTADIMGGFGGTQFTAKDVQETPAYESARLREEQAKATQTQAETKRQFNTNAAIKRKLSNQRVGANEQNEILKKYNALLKTSSQESRTENTLNDDKRMLVSMKSKIGKKTLGGDELSFLNENGVDSKTAAAGGQELLNLVTDMIKDLDRDITAQRKRSNAIEKSLNEFEEDPTAQLSDLLKTGRTITNQEPTRFQQFDDEYSYRVKR